MWWKKDSKLKFVAKTETKHTKSLVSYDISPTFVEHERHPPNYKQLQANKWNNFRTRNQQDYTVEYQSWNDDVYVFQIENKSNTHSVLTNDTEINVVIDFGSTINILNENSLNSIMPKSKLEES